MTTRFGSFDASVMRGFNESQLEARNIERLPYRLAVTDESSEYLQPANPDRATERRQEDLEEWDIVLREHPLASAHVVHASRPDGTYWRIWEEPPDWPSRVEYFQMPRTQGTHVIILRERLFDAMKRLGSGSLLILLDTSGSMSDVPVFNLPNFVAALEVVIHVQINVVAFRDERWLRAIARSF